MTHENLAAALAAFQKTVPTISKDQSANAGKFAYTYAGLDTVTEKVLPALAKEGLAWTAQPTMTDGMFVLAYQLRHEGGETVEGMYPLPSPQTPAQQLGSAITYARRYCLISVTGVAPTDEDDDAQAAQQGNVQSGYYVDDQDTIDKLVSESVAIMGKLGYDADQQAQMAMWASSKGSPDLSAYTLADARKLHAGVQQKTQAVKE